MDKYHIKKEIDDTESLEKRFNEMMKYYFEKKNDTKRKSKI